MLSGINSALSALLGLSRKANVTANNIANINTPGFKSSRLNLSSNTPQTTGTNQIGRGVHVGSISTNFSQDAITQSSNPNEGSLTTSSEQATTEMSDVDLAIEIPTIMLTQRFMQANIKIIQSADEALGSLLDIKT